ncbi:MAG: chemotaxis protein CheW [Thermodesulfobacteriota bacterium]|nr:chemotaxis protein CheW [Thermodesulfobacteriota bacterium]
MKNSIAHCIEQIEEGILDLEKNKGSLDALHNVLAKLGLQHLKLPSAQVVTLFDMLNDGITPVSTEMVTAFLSICEAHKKLLYSMAGFVEERAEKIKAKPPVPQDLEQGDGWEPAPKATGDEIPKEETPSKPKETEKETKKSSLAAAKTKHKESISSIRVNTEKLDHLIEMVGKLMLTYAVISQSGAIDSSASSELRRLDKVINQVKTEVENIRLVPLKQIFVPLHRLIKSLSQKMKKEIHFQITGDDLELDKKIVEDLNEPLVHILRNAVDHGLETSEGRQAAGKDQAGLVHLSAFRKGEFAHIQIRDDGRGLDPEKIRQKALEKGLIDADKSYTNEEIFMFILNSGFSTAEEVTDVSGRGVGMDAVVSAIKDRLDGEVRIESEKGLGTTFILSIPLSRSMSEGIVDALVAKVGKETFVIPIRDVVEVYSPRKNEIVELPGGGEAVSVRGETHPLVRLGEFFNVEALSNNNGLVQVIVVKAGEKNAAILIDEVLRQQQVVVTSFTVAIKEIYQIPILGYGMMGGDDALVVDVEDLLERVSAD